MAARKAWVRVINGEPVCLDAQLPVPKPLDGVHTAQTVAYIPESELSALRAEHAATLKLLAWNCEGYRRELYFWESLLHAETDDGKFHSAPTAVKLLGLLDGKAGGE